MCLYCIWNYKRHDFTWNIILLALLQIFGHVVLGSILWTRAKSLDLKSKTAITSFYMFIWKVI